MGHYYSFIQDWDSENWFEFNDSWVNEFDISLLEQEAFGNKTKVKRNERTNNAYVLFYER